MIKTVPIDDVKPDPNQPRKIFDPKHILDLAKNLKVEGLINPIEVSDDLMIIDSCLEHRVIPIQWSQNPSRFGPIVTASNGVHFTVVSDFQQMLDNMNSIVVTACGS